MAMLRDAAKPDYFMTSIAFFDKTFRVIVNEMKNQRPQYLVRVQQLRAEGPHAHPAVKTRFNLHD
jgi:hypothetical protein